MRCSTSASAIGRSVDEVMQVLRDLGAEMRQDPYFRRLILEPLEVAGVDRVRRRRGGDQGPLQDSPAAPVGRDAGVQSAHQESLRRAAGSSSRRQPTAPYFGADKEGRRAACARRVRTMPSTPPPSRTRGRSQLKPGLISHGRAVADAAGRPMCAAPAGRPRGSARARSPCCLPDATEEPAPEATAQAEVEATPEGVTRRPQKCPTSSRSKGSRTRRCASC